MKSIGNQQSEVTGQQRVVPVDLDLAAISRLWAEYYQLTIETQVEPIPIRQQRRRCQLWTITVVGPESAVANFWAAVDNWLEAHGVF